LLEEAMPPEDIVFLLDRLRPIAGPARRAHSPVLEERRRSEDSVVAVGGPSGSGARELAVELAAHWAWSGRATLLVDANETTPGIARRLGLGLYPHLLTAIDRCRAEGVAGVEAALADQVTPLPFDVIVGLATPRDWDRLVAHDVDGLLATCAAAWERVVVATGPLIEDLQRWGDRFATSRRVLGMAHVVAGTCEPTPRGVLRYLDWIADASQLADDVLTVLNKVPRSKRVASEAAQQLIDVGGALVDDVIELPFDRSVAEAEWDGRLVARGRYHKAVAGVAAAIDVRLCAREDEEVSA
jgi:hypothetical protein